MLHGKILVVLVTMQSWQNIFFLLIIVDLLWQWLLWPTCGNYFMIRPQILKLCYLLVLSCSPLCIIIDLFKETNNHMNATGTFSQEFIPLHHYWLLFVYFWRKKKSQLDEIQDNKENAFFSLLLIGKSPQFLQSSVFQVSLSSHNSLQV